MNRATVDEAITGIYKGGSVRRSVSRIVGKATGIREADAVTQTKIPDVDNIEPFTFFIPDDRSLLRFTAGLYAQFQGEYPKVSHTVSRARNGFEIKISGLPRLPDIKHRLSVIGAGQGGNDPIVPDDHKIV